VHHFPARVPAARVETARVVVVGELVLARVVLDEPRDQQLRSPCDDGGRKVAPVAGRGHGAELPMPPPLAIEQRRVEREQLHCDERVGAGAVADGAHLGVARDAVHPPRTAAIGVEPPRECRALERLLLSGVRGQYAGLTRVVGEAEEPRLATPQRHPRRARRTAVRAERPEAHLLVALRPRDEVAALRRDVQQPHRPSAAASDVARSTDAPSGRREPLRDEPVARRDDLEVAVTMAVVRHRGTAGRRGSGRRDVARRALQRAP
jgi:hypothetical protein